MQKLAVEETIKKDRMSGRLITLLILLVAIFSITRVILANRLIESSASLHDLDQKINEISAQNDSLSSQLRDREALSFISSQAEKMGFTQTPKLTFIQKAPDVALQIR